MSFLQSVKLGGFLSFAPDSPSISLTALNVLIGPNGSGKSNLIEAMEVLHATPVALAALVREGGTAQEWLWKGEPEANHFGRRCSRFSTFTNWLTQQIEGA